MCTLPRHFSGRLAPALLVLLAAACSKAPPSEQGHTINLERTRKAAEQKAQEIAKLKGTPVVPPAAASPTAAPAPTDIPSPATAAAPEPAAPERKPSIALHLSSKQGKGFSMPNQGQVARVQVTPVDALGRPIAEYDPVLGGQLALVAARSDGSWGRILRAPQLSDTDRHTHHYLTVFPEAGAHVLMFAFKPRGAPLVVVPAYIHVAGKSKPDIDTPEESLRFVGVQGLEVALLAGAGRPTVCQDTRVGTVWTSRGKGLALEAGPRGEPRVWYAAIHTGLNAMAPGSPRPLAPAGNPGAGKEATGSAADEWPGDPGTQASLRLDRAGTWRIIASARAGKRDLTALFTVTTQGTAPEGGCAPTPAAAEKP